MIAGIAQQDPAAQTSTGTQGARPPGPAVVEFRSIRKTYHKADGSVMATALAGVTLSIHQGQYVAIMGASGSGKSTLMNILGCLDRPDRDGGVYLLDGRDVMRMSDEELSAFRGQRIGFVFQAFNLISELTIEENVAVPLFYQGVRPADRRARAVESLTKVGLGNRLGHRPKELSGGQQQRVAIARALVGRPVMLLADEPTGNLDSKTGHAILELFDELHSAGMTVVMVTHDDNVAQRCERVVRLRDGIVESDTYQTPVRSAAQQTHEPNKAH